MTVQNIFDFLNLKYPINTALEFDNPGILVGDGNCKVDNVLIALDCTDKIIDLSIQNNCQLIITHHPVIFDPLKSVTAESMIYKLIKSGISVISMHTNLDIGEGGVNDSLCNALNLENITKVTADDGFLLNTATLPSPLDADKFAKVLKQKLGGGIKYVPGTKPIKKLLFCSGSGGSYLSEVLENNCDGFVTADIKHNVFLDAERLGIALFDAGHFNTEDVIIEPLCKILKEQFPNINFTSCHYSTIKTI